MKLVTATPNALYCDTDEALTTPMCNLLLAHGIRGVWRYLSALTPAEVALILASGLELYFVNFAHGAGWQASTAGGVTDAQRDLARLTVLGIPRGVHVAFDCEGPAAGIPALDNHLGSYANNIAAAKYLPALYVGEGALLSSAQLFAAPFVLYWAACSRLVDAANVAQVPWCGYSIIQGRPFDVTLDDGAGTKVIVDYDSVIQDFSGRLPIGVAA
jgi:hypothetical protein